MSKTLQGHRTKLNKQTNKSRAILVAQTLSRRQVEA